MPNITTVIEAKGRYSLVKSFYILFQMFKGKGNAGGRRWDVQQMERAIDAVKILVVYIILLLYIYILYAS